MNQQQKLDLILRELYKNKFDGTYHSILAILTIKADLDTTSEEASARQKIRGIMDGIGLYQRTSI